MTVRGVLVALLLVLVTGCGSTPPPEARQPAAPAGSPDDAPSHAPGRSSTDPPNGQQIGRATSPDRYVALAQELHRAGVRVWFEADLVKAWLAGPQAFATDVRRLGRLAASTHTAGFKVADEIGYEDGLVSVAQATDFLRDVRSGLSKVAPGRPVLIDAVVPDLGCLPWRDEAGRACARSADARHPAASFEAVTSYLRAGLVDRLDLSTGLLEASAYAARGMTTDEAQTAAWQQVRDAGWDGLTTLQARKALAAPGGYRGDAATADADLGLYLDVPLSGGAQAVDVWTWRQTYDGESVGLLAPDLRPNVLWDGLRTRHDSGVSLFTHMTPSTLPASPDAVAHQCAIAAEVFTDVFVAAGTG